jgi:putative ABC transport system substrate-binding protein
MTTRRLLLKALATGILVTAPLARAQQAGRTYVLATPLFFFNGRSVIARAAALHLPAMYQWPAMAEEGGLLGYGPRITDWYRQLSCSSKSFGARTPKTSPSNNRRSSNW